MKKLAVILIVVLLGVFLTGCGIFDLDNFITPDDAEFIACIERLDTPQKIGDYMLENFIYEAHIFYAPDPYELWKLKKGDCNDFMTFGIFVANYHGYETYQLEISYKGTIYKHYIAVYEEDNYYSVTNDKYYYSDFNTFGEIVKYNETLINKKWTKYIVYDYWNKIVEEVEQ